MSDLFVPPDKTAPAPEPIILEEPVSPVEPPPIDNLPDNSAAPVAEAAALPTADLPAAVEVVGGEDPLPEEVPPTAGSAGDEETVVAVALGTDAATTAQIFADATLATVDTLFFYGQIGSGVPTLYAVDLHSGTLSPATASLDLFPTTLDGLFAAEPLAPPIGTEPPTTDRVFTLVQGSDSKNFLIGTAADSALLGLGGDDLILTGAGHNLVFGGLGSDTLLGGIGDDGLFGGANNDTLEGGEGNDLLMGGLGNDVLNGGSGSNVLVGGTGADIFRLNTPGAYGVALVASTSTTTSALDTLVDFNAAEGDLLDFSLIAAQSLFVGRDLLPFLNFVQVGADTHVEVSTPLGRVTTEAILLGVEADTITPANLTFTPPVGLPILK